MAATTHEHREMESARYLTVVSRSTRISNNISYQSCGAWGVHELGGSGVGSPRINLSYRDVRTRRCGSSSSGWTLCWTVRLSFLVPLERQYGTRSNYSPFRGRF